MRGEREHRGVSYAPRYVRGSGRIGTAGWRRWLRRLLALRRHVKVDQEVLDDLFFMERRTLITLMLVETILLYILVPLLGDGVFVWYGLILTLTLWRYYIGYDYLHHPRRDTPLVRHRTLVIHHWLTALLFSLLALFAMPLLDPYYQLFLFIVIMGVSVGAVKTLAEDHRTAIGYLLILLFPLGAEMVLLGRRETLILAFLLGLYLFTQISILLRAHEQAMRLRKANRILGKARELLYEKQELLQSFFEQAAEGIFTYDREMKILDCNQAFLSLFHLRRDQVIGRKVTHLPDEKLVTILRAAMVEGVGSFQNSYRSPRGWQLWIEVKCSPLYDREGETIGGLALIEDKTREYLSLEELRHLVSHDALTSALNRRGLRQYMYEMFRKKEHESVPGLMIYLDLDRFKQINDLYGHGAGDQVLIDIVKRLKGLVPEEGAVARLGGDEFAMVIPFERRLLTEKNATIERWIGRIEECLSVPFRIGERIVESGYSAGVVIIEPGSDAVEEMIKAADISMFRAKRDPGRRYVLYRREMGEEYRKMHSLHRELERAIRRDQLVLFFHPIVEAGSGKIFSAEVLLRWRHPEKGLLTPDRFLPVARQFGLIPEIDRWVLERTCAMIARWKREGGMPLESLSVNVDAVSLFRVDFPGMLRNLFARYGVRGEELVLEITEDSLVENFDRGGRVLREFQAMGIECAIDDFGTGYSSLAYLKKLSFDILKIDRAFVQDMLDRIENIFLLQAIIDMGRKLNYRIIVEGVETQRQREILSGIDPEIACQGYLFARPVEEESLMELLSAETDVRGS